MSRTTENTAFACLHCGLKVLPLSNGSYRNHCPRCLYSKHLDVAPGDRASSCKGPMKPVGMRYKSGKGFQIVHRCTACGVVRRQQDRRRYRAARRVGSAASLAYGLAVTE